jgi:hypothetical protein
VHRGTYTAAWGTQSLVPLSLCAHMALVRLPPLRSTAADGAATSDHACELQNWLYEQHRIEVPVKCVQVSDTSALGCSSSDGTSGYIRFSGVSH